MNPSRRSTVPALLRRAFLVAADATLLGSAAVAAQFDIIEMEELKDIALRYGKYNGRFITCDIDPPVPIKVAVLKYARSRGASDPQLDILGKVFDEGQARTTGLKTGFSKPECQEKLETPEGKKILKNVETWGKLPAKP
ncbi:MAG: hypothetical protein FJ144_10125 [Deltaproteobacteria bacterium]|nr:hypothetical protein [Deltaproteobacteria bacterium]